MAAGRRQYADVRTWPASPGVLAILQEELAAQPVTLWRPSGRSSVGGCFVCFAQAQSGPGEAGDLGWAGAALGERTSVASGPAPSAYGAGLLALREGPLLEQAVRALEEPSDVLLVNATGRDHPRGAGLALHLGAVLGVPTVGVTHRPLLASGNWPADGRGATSPTAASSSATGCERGRVPGRSPFTRGGGPGPRWRSRSFWAPPRAHGRPIRSGLRGQQPVRRGHNLARGADELGIPSRRAHSTASYMRGRGRLAVASV